MNKDAETILSLWCALAALIITLAATLTLLVGGCSGVRPPITYPDPYPYPDPYAYPLPYHTQDDAARMQEHQRQYQQWVNDFQSQQPGAPISPQPMPLW